MASTYPMKKNTGVTIVFPIFDNDGDLVSSAADLDSEYSLDSGGFNNCAAEASEIGSSGIYSLALASGETNGDVVCIQIKTSTADAKTTVLVFYTSAQTLDEMDAVIDSILTESQSHPTLAEIEAGLMATLALEATLGTHDTDIKALLTTVQADLDNPNQYKADVSVLALEASLGTHDTDIKNLLSTIQTDLDNPNQYKADVSALALEATLGTHDTDIKNLLSTIQTDLDNPNQYKADVGALALEATLGTHDTDIKALLNHATYGLSALKTEIDANETKMDDLDADLVTHATALGTHDTDIKALLAALNDLSAANVWTYVTRTLTDKAGFALSAAGIQAIWDIAITNLTTAGSIGELMVLAGKILKNRWRIVGNQFVVYDDDDTTILLAFNLFDSAAVASETDVYERDPI